MILGLSDDRLLRLPLVASESPPRGCAECSMSVRTSPLVGCAALCILFQRVGGGCGILDPR